MIQILLLAIFTNLFTLKGKTVKLNVVTFFQHCGHPPACNKFKFFLIAKQLCTSLLTKRGSQKKKR